MKTQPSPSMLDTLRARIQRLETAGRPAYGVLPFGVDAMDRVLPDGGLARGAVHDVYGDAGDAVSAATLFVSGIAARSGGRVLWISTRPDLFAPGLRQAGLMEDRVIHAVARNNPAVLNCFEEGLRHRGLGAVVAEIAQLDLTASRRLQLAAEQSGVLGIVLRRAMRRGLGGQPIMARTRWRVTAMPSAPLPVRGVARGRWRIELVRTRAGVSAIFDVEECDAQGRLVFMESIADRLDPSATMADGSAAAETGRRRAAG